MASSKGIYDILILGWIQERKQGATLTEGLHLVVFTGDTRGSDFQQYVAIRPHGLTLDQGSSGMLVSFVWEFRSSTGAAFDQDTGEALFQQQGGVLGGEGDTAFVRVGFEGDTYGESGVRNAGDEVCCLLLALILPGCSAGEVP